MTPPKQMKIYFFKWSELQFNGIGSYIAFKKNKNSK